MKYSIVIGSYNHCDDLLRPCIDSIFKYTNLDNAEIIVVANGCTDNTKEYLKSLGGKVRWIWKDEPQGYPKAINLGISAAKGEYIILLNNDTVLLEQPKNAWIDMLTDPFLKNPNTGITGPVKFDWDCGGIRYDAMAFWLVMIPRRLFKEIGLLDEIFSPGMGEDGDFCIKTIKKGYNLVSVPEDVKGTFEDGIVNFKFPIWHAGNGTFGDNHEEKILAIAKNNQILEERYGKKNMEVSIIIPTYNHLDDALRPCLNAVLAYTDLTDKEVIVVANGCTDGTREFLESLKGKIKYIWFDEPQGVIIPYNAGIDAASGKYIVTLDNDSILQPQPTDMWINILKEPFLKDQSVGGASPFAHQYEDIGLLLHTGCSMYRADVVRKIGKFDTDYYPGYFCDPDLAARIWKAGYKCVEVPENTTKTYTNGIFGINFPVVHMGTVQTMNKQKDNALVEKNRNLLYTRHAKIKKPTFSIVIPTYNHCDDLLKPCCESIMRYSDLNTLEVIVVANGCVDNTKLYVESLGHPFKLVWIDEQLGYTKAINQGLKHVNGDYVVLLNNDTELLPQPTNAWLHIMQSAFSDPLVGMSGPLKLWDNYSDIETIIFFCAMIRRDMFDKLGVLDEIYTPGGGEDIDFSARMYNAGYRIVECSPRKYSAEAGTNIGEFPIWHKDNQTFKHISEYSKVIIKRNGLLNTKRYNKNIKLNLGAGGISYNGFLSVDKYDGRADISMDITKLDFDSNTVSEILASHVFEHLNPYHSHAILQEWLRVLKPGGKLVMEMPNIEELCKRFVTASTGERYGILNAIYGSVNTTGEGGPDNITSPHLFGWWPQSMLDHLINAGYVNIQFMDEQIPHPESNFRVEAYKPYHLPIDRDSLLNQEPAAFIEVIQHNGYHVEDHEVQGKTIIDVGANIGVFSLYAAERGASRILAFEAQPTIYKTKLLENVKNYSHIEAYNYAVYSSNHETVYIPNHDVGSKISSSDGEPVETISLSSILERYRVIGNDLTLKLDCEGSEFDILLTSSPDVIKRFAVIYIELHGNTNKDPKYWDINLIKDYLTKLGYKQEFSDPVWGYHNNGEAYHLGVQVEKYVRI